MKKLCMYLVLIGLGIIIFSGCSIVDQSSSSVSRTIGLGEEALPIERGSFGIEVSFKKIRTLDKIYVTEYEVWDEDDTEISATGSNTSSSYIYNDYTLRLGLTDLDELSLGLLAGSEGGTNTYSYSSGDDTTTKKFQCRTKLTGFKIGYKRLLSNPEKPLRVSMFMSLSRNLFDSIGQAAKYDAHSLETRAAILLGTQNDLHKRTSYPTVAIYHSSAHTERNKSISGISREKHLQAIGAELLYTLKLGPVYSSVGGGVENQIVGEDEFEKVQYYMSFKLGLRLGRRVQ